MGMLKEMLKKSNMICSIYEYLYFLLDNYKRKFGVSAKSIKRYKNSKKGKRCFIIGNGPSLTISDLNKINEFGDDSFAVNRIYKLFDKTDWRPSYYVSQDSKVIEESKDNFDLIKTNCKNMFISTSVGKKCIKKFKNQINFFYINTSKYYPHFPKFSFDVAKQVYEGMTVAYGCIQLAVYMGYKEIYLIGTDHNYNTNMTPDGKLEIKSNVSNYMPELAGETLFAPRLDESTLAYKKARQVCEDQGIKIMNATRGGKLEVFERVDFDSLFLQKS